MSPHIAQELDIVERCQPLGVVEHQGRGLALAEPQEASEHALDRLLVALDGLDGKDAPGLVLAGRVADPRGAAAHERDRLAARALQPSEHHDGNEMPNVQGWRRAVVADVADHFAVTPQTVEAGKIGTLVDIAALIERMEKI